MGCSIWLRPGAGVEAGCCMSRRCEFYQYIMLFQIPKEHETRKLNMSFIDEHLDP
jgi:hypothetical protein